MIPCSHKVVVCVMKGWKGKPLITMGLSKFFASTYLVITGRLTHTVVADAHKVIVCIVKGLDKRGSIKIVFQWPPLGPLKLFASSYFR